MSPSPTTRTSVFVAAAAALSVLSAGCIVQDRPEHPEFFVVADAGADLALPVGATAHFEWDEHDAIESEGEHAPEVEVEYAWRSSESEDEISNTTAAALSRAGPGLALVSLEVEAGGARAADVAGVLFTPTDADTARSAFVAVVGGIRFWDGAGAPQPINDVEVEGFRAQWAEVDLQAAQGPSASVVLDFPEADVAIGAEVQGSVIVAVKRGAGPATIESTGPVTFTASNYYEVRIPESGGAPTLGQWERGSTNTVFQAFDGYAANHTAEGATRVLVAESQTLPGFEGPVAAAALGLLAIAASRRRS